ncbi:indole-3-glycerol phosphate synthase domain protein [Burkholderia thailandensis]|uniref:Indole-3-glycerol phosphate synthase domain protein n=1 Tax=Burkholderia thailandensis TaxID=57975 RepID=A0AAW9CSW8_BURTH|nr:indole-3-glycerol phosphate synthase domain protein [Burkholderia thailandensis]
MLAAQRADEVARIARRRLQLQFFERRALECGGDLFALTAMICRGCRSWMSALRAGFGFGFG